MELTSTPVNSTTPTLSSSAGAGNSASPFAALLQDHTPKGAAERVESQSKDIQALPPEIPRTGIESPGRSLIEAWIKGQKPAPLAGAGKTAVPDTATKGSLKVHAKRQNEAANVPTTEPVPDSQQIAPLLLASAPAVPIPLAPSWAEKVAPTTERAQAVESNSEKNAKLPAIAQLPQISPISAQKPQVGTVVVPQELATAAADWQQKVLPIHPNQPAEPTAKPEKNLTNAAKLEKPNHSENAPAELKKLAPSQKAPSMQLPTYPATDAAKPSAPNAIPINVAAPAAVPKAEFTAETACTTEKSMQVPRDSESGVQPKQPTAATQVSTHSTPTPTTADRAKNHNGGSENRQDQSHKGSQINGEKSPSPGIQQPVASQEPAPAVAKETLAAPTHASIPPATVRHSAEAAPQSASTPAVNTHSNMQGIDVSSRAPISTPQVSGARLIAHQQYSELQLKIHSEDLGAVQIRATMRAGQIGAAISADRPEAREALSSAMPALHQALRDRDVRVEQISVIDRSQASNDFNSGSGSQQSGTPQQNKQNITQVSYSPAEGLAGASAETERQVVSESALVDIHA